MVLGELPCASFYASYLTIDRVAKSRADDIASFENVISDLRSKFVVHVRGIVLHLDHALTKMTMPFLDPHDDRISEFECFTTIHCSPFDTRDRIRWFLKAGSSRAIQLIELQLNIGIMLVDALE